MNESKINETRIIEMLKMTPCRWCGAQKPTKEVKTEFMHYGKKSHRFRMCKDCRRIAQKSYRRKGQIAA